MRILITGAAGFIGHALAKRLLEQGHEVTGIDALNEYYSPLLKRARLEDLGVEAGEFPYGGGTGSGMFPAFFFSRLNLEDREGLAGLFARRDFEVVVNLAAQAGVRYSLENPYAYVESNVLGFVNLLECCRRRPVRHLVYASSSSVYGGNGKIPFSEDDPVNDPVSLYAATKRCDELIAHVYARLYRIPSTGLRLFTVYGPWGRPDMAPMLFSRAILAGEPIRVFNNGDLSRDFTYIDDIIDAVALLLDEVPDEGVPAAVYNIGCGRPMRLMDFIHALEDALGRKAELEMLPMQKGDVHQTYADTEKLRRKIRRSPDTPLEEGIRRFAEWYRSPRNPLR